MFKILILILKDKQMKTTMKTIVLYPKRFKNPTFFDDYQNDQIK